MAERMRRCSSGTPSSRGTPIRPPQRVKTKRSRPFVARLPRLAAHLPRPPRGHPAGAAPDVPTAHWTTKLTIRPGT
jgi:hypothetical protein